jgi:hypothetical protein
LRAPRRCLRSWFAPSSPSRSCCQLRLLKADTWILSEPLKYTRAFGLTSSRLSDYSLVKERHVIPRLLLAKVRRTFYCKRRWQLPLPSSWPPVRGRRIVPSVRLVSTLRLEDFPASLRDLRVVSRSRSRARSIGREVDGTFAARCAAFSHTHGNGRGSRTSSVLVVVANATGGRLRSNCRGSSTATKVSRGLDYQREELCDPPRLGVKPLSQVFSDARRGDIRNTPARALEFAPRARAE